MSETRNPDLDVSPETMVVPLPSGGGSPLANGSLLPSDPSQTQYYSEQGTPTQLGRYVIDGYLGSGGFGLVYRARDEQLDRLVAVKVPHLHRIQKEAEKRLYIAEARTVAKLDHPGVVTVYDYGVLEDGRSFVVSKMIDGRNLAQVMVNERLSVETSVALLISVAETLHYVHARQLIHRDIKPSNLLIDSTGKIYVADFGLALHESDAASHLAGAGTPNYMSPEQAGGEGHRIDCRTDLFSLGTVMYEMLTGARPFVGSTPAEVIEKLKNEAPVPLTTHDERIPAELSRICMKLLSKRASDRYQDGQDLAEDLKYFQSPNGVSEAQSHQPSQNPAKGATTSVDKSQVVPRGLRSYDRHDAYFFLKLLPGPYDRDGLPESLSHWQSWVNHPEDRPELHRIGIIAGPSGCGKSSLIRAGLLPLLDKSVSSLAIEATIDRTEAQLASALDSRFPDLQSHSSLTDKLIAIRRGKALPAGRKLLIVIDQFEQWLHTVHEREHPELIRALRQCDGHRIQCIVLVRDDFWLALNRFMEAVETPLVVGQNVRLVDLFDLSHARNVLTRFGRAFGRIPSGDAPPSAETRKFIDMAVQYLAKEGKVFPVHLSLFAEMVKARDWVPSTLDQLGGAVGVGVQFLRESFSAAHAPAGNRMHEEAVRRVLEGLLPEVGTQIKTRHRTREEMLKLSGYEDDPKRFENLMSIFEGQLKLISPVDVMDHSRSSAEHQSTELHYQLSHDFLVPSIREWLYSEQRKSYAGRCRLLLVEQAAAWTKQQNRRNLPLWRDWIQYRALLRPSTLNEPERRMLQAADRTLGLQTLLGLCLIVLGAVGVESFRSWNQGHSLLGQLRTTSVESAPAIIDQLKSHRRFAERELMAAIQSVKPGTPEEFNLRLAQIHWDPAAVTPLLQQALDSRDAMTLLVTRESLHPYREQCIEECWTTVTAGATDGASDEEKKRGFRAAMLLSRLDPPTVDASTKRWQVASKFVAEETISWALRNPVDYQSLVDGMQPVSGLLTPSLSEALGVSETDDRTRSKISFLRDFHAGDDRTLTSFLLRGSPWQWDDLRPRIKTISPVWLQEVLYTPRDTSSPDAEIAWERQHSVAAAVLLSISSNEDAWNLLRHSPQPGLRSQLIDRMAVLGVNLALVEDRLIQEVALESKADIGILSGLLMAMGQYPDAKDSVRETTRLQVRALFEAHNDSGVHSAAQWLMRHCQIPMNDSILVTSGVDYKPGRRWRVTPEGHVMIQFDGRQAPGIGRVFEICATEVTVKQFLTFSPGKYYSSTQAPTEDCPINVVKWPEALRYSDWLSDRHGLDSSQFCILPTQTDDQLDGVFPDVQKQGYRPPTRAEWEFACRAGTQTRWHFGNDPEMMSRYAWYSENSMALRIPDKSGNSESKGVGLLSPNPAGVFDMYGNVKEWCANAPDNSTEKRFVQGGSHNVPVWMLESDGDLTTPTNTEFNTLGLRIARTVADPNDGSR